MTRLDAAAHHSLIADDIPSSPAPNDRLLASRRHGTGV
jgi:hypothetical protein